MERNTVIVNIRKKVGLLVLAMLCFGFVFGANTVASHPVSVFAATTVNAPKASLKAGTYKVRKNKSVELTCSTQNATIYYKINNGSYKEYTGPISITRSCTLYAYAKTSSEKSKTVSYAYKLQPVAVVSLDSGTYSDTQKVYASSAAQNVKIYYTTDGTKPTTESQVYNSSKGIKVSSSCTVKFLFKKAGWTNRYITKEYTIIASVGNKTTEDTPYAQADFVSTYENKPFYKTLSDSDKAIYRAMYEAFAAHKDSIVVSGNDVGDVCFNIYQYVVADCPEFWYVNDGRLNWSWNEYGEYTIYFSYTDSVSRMEERTPILEKNADKILKEAAANTGNQFEYVKYFYDAICDMTTYTLGNYPDRDTAGTDDILIDGRGLCAAYARAFAYLCQRAGIPCVLVGGHANNGTNGWGEHAWNKIYLDNEWYVVDATWGDTDSITDYSYFCTNDDMLSSNHRLSSVYDVSSLTAKGQKYYYYTYLGITVYSDYQEAYKALNKGVQNNLKNGEYHTEIVCETEDIAVKLFNKIASSGLDIPGRYQYSYKGRNFWVDVVP